MVCPLQFFLYFFAALSIVGISSTNYQKEKKKKRRTFFSFFLSLLFEFCEKLFGFLFDKIWKVWAWFHLLKLFWVFPQILEIHSWTNPFWVLLRSSAPIAGTEGLRVLFQCFLPFRAQKVTKYLVKFFFSFENDQTKFFLFV